MESGKNDKDELICKAKIETQRMGVWILRVGGGLLGWIGSLGLTHSQYQV